MGPRLRRLEVLVVAAGLAGTAYAWALGQAPLDNYYGAAVRSMSLSWHNFIFGALDPAGTVTTDKLPGAFWMQALAVRLFGFHTWAIVLPQVIEGVLAVLVLYGAVKRLAGPTAGLIAAFVLALSPATVALNRGNTPDSLMILLLVLAADAVSRAIADGRQRWLVLAAVWVGLAFQAKMIEAWMVLPALGLTYLVVGPGATIRRLRQLAIAGAVAGLVSLTWMTVITLIPAHDRPYVDGSNHNSVYQQVFVYNGFGRFGEQTPMQLFFHQVLGPHATQANGASPTPNRLLRGDLGRNSAWLLPAATAIAVWGVASRRRRPRGDPLRSCFILWGLWLLTFAATFTFSTTINSYYTAALAPPVAALLGAGVSAAWSEHREDAGRRIGLAIIIVVTTAYAVWLIPSSGTGVSGWLVPSVIAIGGVASAVCLASVAIKRDTVFAVAIASGLVATCLAPAVASAELVAHKQGPFDVPFESRAEAKFVGFLFSQIAIEVKHSLPLLKAAAKGAPYLLATQTAMLAAEVVYVSGLEALPIGGFTGTIPAPTLTALKQDIRHQRFRLVLTVSNSDPRLKWVAQHCIHVADPLGLLHAYYCLPGIPG